MGGQLSLQSEEVKSDLNKSKETFLAMVNETHDYAVQVLNEMATRVTAFDTVKLPRVSDKEHDEFRRALDVFGNVMKQSKIFALARLELFRAEAANYRSKGGRDTAVAKLWMNYQQDVVLMEDTISKFEHHLFMIVLRYGAVNCNTIFGECL